MPKKVTSHVDDPAEVGRRLREAREARGLSQRGLAFPGCSPAYISRIEAGGRTPSLHLLRDLGARLGVSEAWLAQGRDSTAEAVIRDAEVALRLDDDEQAAELYQRAFDEEGPAGDKAVRSQALEGLGQLALRQNEPRRAIELLREALAITGDDEVERPALAASLARMHAALGELAPAISILERCLEHHSDDPIEYARFATLLGAALADSGDTAAAERVVAGALTRSRESSDLNTRARHHWSQSRLQREQGKTSAAEESARKTLELLRRKEDTLALAQTTQALAQLRLDLGRPDEALDLLQEGLPLVTAAATPLQIARYRVAETQALAALGRHEQAAALAIELEPQLEDAHPADRGRAYVALAETMAQSGQAQGARKLFERAIDLLEQEPPGRHLLKAYKGLSALLRAQGDTEAALELLDRTLDIQERAGKTLA